MNMLSPVLNLRAILTFFSILYKQRELTLEMTKREFSERYAGQVLGVLWGFAHPVVIILVYIFIFSFVFQSRVDPGDTSSTANYAIYMLAGLIPWMALAETLNKGTQVITSNSNLVKQVIFPLEILPAKTVIASFINQIILLIGVLLFAGIQMGGPTWSLCLLPFLLALQFIQMLGVSMILSTLGAYIRDLKDLIQVFCLINIYLMPVIYMPSWLPSSVRWLIYLNPFSYQTLCFQDAIYHGSITHWWTWLIYCLLSFLMLGIGYRLFLKLRISIGNVL
jgi:lipopolysaccharide transport system permease protein